MSAKRIALGAGVVAFALIAGALAFQYLDGLAPCEMCHWQRWPLIAAAFLGIIGSSVPRSSDDGAAKGLAALVLVLIAASGAIGAYQAGVEWHWWAGPTACTGARFTFEGLNNLNNEPVVRCDVAAWRLFGISLAGYNAIVSLGTALVGVAAWRRR